MYVAMRMRALKKIFGKKTGMYDTAYIHATSFPSQLASVGLAQARPN